MHPLSAANMKGRRDHPTNLKPREGTKLRALFDQFYANKGKIVQLDYTINKHKPGLYLQIDQLNIRYGLDIRCLGRKRWCLVGEWFGDTYVDYVAK